MFAPIRLAYASLPWQCLYFLPLPQGHGSFLPTLGTALTGVFGAGAFC
jgi:hypothetical protein